MFETHNPVLRSLAEGGRLGATSEHEIQWRRRALTPKQKEMLIVKGWATLDDSAVDDQDLAVLRGESATKEGIPAAGIKDSESCHGADAKVGSFANNWSARI